MPPVTVTTGHDASYFVVPYALNVTATDPIGVTLNRPAILDSIATTCNATMNGTHVVVLSDVNLLGPAFNPAATYCWGYFLFRKL